MKYYKEAMSYYTADSTYALYYLTHICSPKILFVHVGMYIHTFLAQRKITKLKDNKYIKILIFPP